MAFWCNIMGRNGFECNVIEFVSSPYVLMNFNER
jgi:hypothetical protein